MGYASLQPTAFYKIVSGGIGAGIKTITTGNNNYSLGTLTTPAYHGTPDLAYITLIVNAHEDTSGAPNWFKSTNGGHLGMVKGGGTTFDCGTVTDGELYIKANAIAYGEWMINGNENIADHLEPSTAYTCQLMHWTALGDSLLLHSSRFELSMYFNI